MKKLHVYAIYLEDATGVIKVDVPSTSKKEAMTYCAGNGDIVAVKDSTIQDIDIQCLADTLKNAGWGQIEIDVITRALTICGLDRA